MSTTIGTSISRIRNITKTVKEDAFITDRFIYSLIIKHAKFFIRKQDSLNQLIKFNSLWRTLPCLDLIEVDKVEACCGGITSDCTIMRTKRQIPGILEAVWGPLFRTVSSIDGSIEVVKTDPATYTSMTKTSTFKYNTTKYYWFINNYLYFPNIPWEAIKLEGIFEDNIASYGCDDPCTIRQDQDFLIPGYLFTEIEQQVLNDLGMTIKLPADPQDDKQNQNR